MSVLLALLRGPTADGSERKRDELWNRNCGSGGRWFESTQLYQQNQPVTRWRTRRPSANWFPSDSASDFSPRLRDSPHYGPRRARSSLVMSGRRTPIGQLCAISTRVRRAVDCLAHEARGRSRGPCRSLAVGSTINAAIVAKPSSRKPERPSLISTGNASWTALGSQKRTRQSF
jgi:hypothetical protein